MQLHSPATNMKIADLVRDLYLAQHSDAWSTPTIASFKIQNKPAQKVIDVPLIHTIMHL